MKRQQFVRRLIQDGCQLLRAGSRHDIYLNPKTGLRQPVPRHSEIDNALAKHIRKYLGLQ